MQKDGDPYEPEATASGHELKIRARRAYVAFVIIVFGLAAVWAFFLAPSEASKRVSVDRKCLTIAVAREALAGLVIIAQEKGYFGEEGLHATVKEYPSGKLALLGMLEGESDLATVAEVPVVFQSFERDDFCIFATIGSSSDEGRVVARKDRGILQAEDLRGRRLGTQRGSAVHYFLHAFLIEHGLSEDDITLSFYKARELPEALARGDIDAFSMREPFVTEAKRLLGDRAIVFAAPGVYEKTFHVAARKRFRGEEPDALWRLLRGLVRAEEFFMSEKEKAAGIVAEKLGVERSEVLSLWGGRGLGVSLKQSLLISLEARARWATRAGLTGEKRLPNFLDYICPEGLQRVKARAVTVIR